MRAQCVRLRRFRPGVPVFLGPGDVNALHEYVVGGADRMPDAVLGRANEIAGMRSQEFDCGNLWDSDLFEGLDSSPGAVWLNDRTAHPVIL
jgi:hypothetical protein